MDSKSGFGIILLGLIRHALSMGAALLGAYGVSAAQQTSFVDSAAPIILAVVMFLAAQIWAYVSKTNALATPPSR